MVTRGSKLSLTGKRWIAVLFVLGLGLLLGSSPAHAGGVVGGGTPGSCTWAALNAALTGGGSVTFDCGSVPVTISLSGSLVVFGGETATVDGGDLITLDGNDMLQIFYVVNGGTLHLRNIDLIRGRSGSGGAIYNEQNGTLDLDRVEIGQSVAEGTSSGSGGGGIYTLGTLRIDRSVLLQNQALNSVSPPRSGGALLVGGGTATVRNTTFIANSANYGAAIYQPQGTLTLENVSLINNVAWPYTHNMNTNAGEGGAIYTFAALNLTNTTFTGNIADTGGGLFAANFSNNTLLNVTMNANRADTGGGIFNNSSNNITLKNTIVANSRDRADTSDSLNCDSNGAATTSLGFNVIGDNSCFLAPTTGDQTSTNPLLGPLADNGGPTLTFMPQASSPAINQGTNSGCPARDQRGAFRPFGPTCDVGAVEYGGRPPSPLLWLPVVERH
jgi:hypothetical protein